MIKLKSLLCEKMIKVVTGIISPEKGILSSYGFFESHRYLGYHHGLKWRYNPETKKVYWSSFNNEEETEEDKFRVEDYIHKKYGFIVHDHVDLGDCSIVDISNAHGTMKE